MSSGSVGSRRSGGQRSVAGWVLLAAVFLLIHVVLASINLLDTGLNAMGDVTGVYRYWIDYWHSNGVLVGIDTAWVYPIAALPPMLLASLFGSAAYGFTWLLLVTVLDAVALVLLARENRLAAWWWLAATAALGPVALGRIDSIALPVVIAGVLQVAKRPAVATVLFTVATWIKVWPAAFVLAMIIAVRRRSIVIAAAALTSAAIIGIALAAGARGTIFSFITAQTGRSLQIEAPISALWLWDAALGTGGTKVYYDTTLLTYQVTGIGVAATAAVMTWILAAGVAIVVLFGILAVRRRADRVTVIASTALGIVAAIIALNKVGSPQYFTWLAGPVLLGLLVAPRRFRTPAVLVLVLDVLTQVIYPWGYGNVLALDPIYLGILDIRDLLEFVLLGWALQSLLTARRSTTVGAAHLRAARSHALR